MSQQHKSGEGRSEDRWQKRKLKRFSGGFSYPAVSAAIIKTKVSTLGGLS
jgi:hypothetical protein